jgi:hypothetical protein
MVQVAELIDLLGKSTEDPEVMKLLESLKLKKQPRAKYDEPRADVEVKKQGWGMAFEDEDYLLRTGVKHYGEGKMILTALFFFPESNKSGYKGFQGELVNGVRLSDSRSEILRKLGEPHAKYESEGVRRNERWHYGEYRLVVNYTPQGEVKHMTAITQKYE